ATIAHLNPQSARTGAAAVATAIPLVPALCVECRMVDGTSYKLMADGRVGFQPGEGHAWIWTGLDGSQVAVNPDGGVHAWAGVPAGRMPTPHAHAAGAEPRPVSHAKLVDPETKAQIWVRSDHVMFVAYRDGSTLAMHADGTRIYCDVAAADPNKKSLTVECPG